ncbi:MAG: SDR family oxidoreductase [Cryomorphaceae bacterium]|nr:SDR family oxidoreductase [Cryomorphaceae bacterium]
MNIPQPLKNAMLPQDSFKGKTILITGGATGLGFSMGKMLIELGANLCIMSRKLEALEAAKNELQHFGDGHIWIHPCDVRNAEEVETAIDYFLKSSGDIDALINNAAGNFIAPTASLSHNAFDTVLDIVLKGSKNCTLTLGKHWIQSGKGCKTVLNIVTTYASTGSAFVVPSAMAKAGVLAMTRSLAVEWARYGIRQVAIAPGPFPTEGAWERLFPGGLDKKLGVINQIPLKRAGDHRELANLASYLLSDFAAFINGEVVTIDGGEWLKGAGEMNFLLQLSDEQWASLKRS